MKTLARSLCLALALLIATPLFAADAAPAVGAWTRRATAAGVDKAMAVAVGFPENKAENAVFTTAGSLPAGVYELQFDAASSHVGDGIAWNGALTVREPLALTLTNFPAIQFGSPAKTETRTAIIVQPKNGPLRIVFGTSVQAMDMGVAFTKRVSDSAPTGNRPSAIKSAAPAGKGPLDMSSDAGGLDLVELSPAKQFYFLVDNVRLRKISEVGYPTKLNVPKIRYLPGEEFKGSVELASFEGTPATGELSLFIENGLQTRTLAKKIPVPAFTGRQTIDFTFTLPKEELGAALIASFARADGSEPAERREFFTIAENFYRVAIHYTGVMGRNKLKIDADELRGAMKKIKENYANCYEIFAWAQEDMVGMSPAQDVWFSGQTCYQISKAYMQAMIRASHDNGIAAVSYGKFIMSGYLGWKTAWDRPLDHRMQFDFPVGMWDGVSEHDLQWFRYNEFIPENRPDTGGAFSLSRPGFIPINPDETPPMARIAAEEIVRSMKMFGWDGIRWDGHPRGDNMFAGQLGGPGKLDPYQARKTQALVKYIKDIVAKEVPTARWGYNYLFTHPNPTHDWAVQDHELDELCADGGLIMNESIRKSHGSPFEHIARNIQVEADLARERGGYLLCISCDEVSVRDSFIEGIIYYAGGCRPYGVAGAFTELNRYATRYGCYTLDERLRRLNRPEAVIKPVGPTTLWWTPFVYETPRNAKGESQLVVNLMNLPYKDLVLAGHDKNSSYNLKTASEPATFQLTLPAGYTSGAVKMIDPFTLGVSTLAVKEGVISVPSVPVWSVMIIDLASDQKTVRISEQFGPAPTINRVRPNTPNVPQIVLDPAVPPLKLWQQMLDACKNQEGGWTGASSLESEKTASLPEKERNATLMKLRDDPWLAPEKTLVSLYSSSALKPDFDLKEQAKLPPIPLKRNGVLDVFEGCGVLADRLRLDEALATVPRFALSTGDLGGGRGRFGMNNLAPDHFPGLDLVVFHDIPATAVGAGNSYAMLRWVKAGGGALFTGGPFSFGKGAYIHTILDRELLPVQIAQQLDIKYIQDGAIIEPGPDFDLLGLPAGFRDDVLKTKPKFWAFNEVALRPGADVKVFLKAGNRPILVGWKLGEGHVACLLAATMGTSENGQVAFAEWSRWPELLGATVKWLAPGAGEVTPKAVPLVKEREAAIQTLEDKRVDRMIESGLDAKPAVKNAAGAADQAKSLAAIRTILANGEGDPASAAVLTDQLGADAGITVQFAEEIVRFLAKNRPPTAKLVEGYKRCSASSEPTVQSLGQQMLGMAGTVEFVNAVRALGDPQTAGVPQARWGTMLGIALCPSDDLIPIGVARCAAWQALSDKRFKQYTDGKGYSIEFPPVPHLDSDALLERAAWFSYLARRKPDLFAGPMLREWLLLRQYLFYTDQTIGVFLERAGKGPPIQAGPLRVKAAQAGELGRFYWQLGFLLEAQAREIFSTRPKDAADAVSQTFCRREVEFALNLIGRTLPKDAKPILERLVAMRHTHLGAVAERRLKEAKE